MNTFLSKKRNSLRKGFTLLEVIVVIAIIAILAALSVAGYDLIREKTRDNKAKVLIDGLANALENYNIDHNGYPDGDGRESSSIDLYKALYGDFDLDGVSDKGNTVYFHKLDPELTGAKMNVSRDKGYLIIDPWENPIYYRSPGEVNPSSDFDLWSLGPDEKGGPGGSDKYRHDDLDNF